MSKYSEKQFSDDVYKKLSLWFDDYGIEEIYKEYNLEKIYKCDYYIRTSKYDFVIELKLKLNAFDIGQLLNYVTLARRKTNKIIYGCLIFNDKNIKNLKILIDTIKTFNLHILVIDYQENKLYLKRNISENYNIGNELYVDTIKQLQEPKISNIPECMKRYGVKKINKTKNKKKIRKKKKTNQVELSELEKLQKLPMSSNNYFKKLKEIEKQN